MTPAGGLAAEVGPPTGRRLAPLWRAMAVVVDAPSLGRWTLVVAALAAFAVLVEMSLAAAASPPELGLRAGRSADGLALTWVQPTGIGWDAGLRPGQVVTAVDGRPVGVAEPPSAVGSADSVDVVTPEGKTIAAAVASYKLPLSPSRQLIFVAIAASFLVVGGGVYILAAEAAVARVIFGWGAAAAAMLVAAVASLARAPLPIALSAMSFSAFGAGTFLLFLVFPVNRLRTRAGRYAATACLASAAAAIGAYGWFIVVDQTYWLLFQRVSFVLVAVHLLGASGLVVVTFVRSWKQRPVRRALSLVASGAAVGLAPVCLLYFLPRALGAEHLVEPGVAILSVVLLPTMLGAAVLSRQFLGIDRLVRRGLIAVMIWLVLLTVYTIAAQAVQRLDLPDAGFGATVLTIAVVGGTFLPLQARLRFAVERWLFHDVYRYAETLQRLSAEVARLGPVEPRIADHILDRLGRTLDLSWAGVVLAPGSPHDVEDALVGLEPQVRPTTRLYEWGDAPPAFRQDGSGWLAAADRPRPPTDGRATETLIPLRGDGQPVGVLVMGVKRRDVELSPQDSTLLATLAPLFTTAFQNARLVQDLENRVAALAEREEDLSHLSAQLMRVQEEERMRLALDVHDDPLQRAILLARRLGDDLEPALSAPYRTEAEEIVDALRAICSGLRPRILDDFGLVAGLEVLVNDVRARCDLIASLGSSNPAGPPVGRLGPDLEIALYRVAQEALANCMKHAQATEVRVTLDGGAGALRLVVADNGRGLGVAASAADASAHLGQVGMRERLRPWGGRVSIQSQPSGGTVVTAVVPWSA